MTDRLSLDDRAFSAFCASQPFPPSGTSVFTHLKDISAEDFEAVRARNAARARHLGFEFNDIALQPSAMATRQSATWTCSNLSDKEAKGWIGGVYTFKGQNFLDEPYLIFVGEYLFHVVKPSSAGRLFKIYLGSGIADDPQVTVLSRSGIVPTTEGADFMQSLPPALEFRCEKPPTNLRRRIEANHYLSKKSMLGNAFLKVDKNKQAFMAMYQKVNHHLAEVYGYRSFASHGTLLGLVRNGDLIPNDDDFDCAYFSRHRDVVSVARETHAICASLRASGLYTFMGATGHIKVQSGSMEIDLMPAWHDGETFNVSGYTAIAVPESAILPLRPQPWLTGEVLIPAEPERFLEGNYGPGWRVPDPFYQSAPNARARKHLKVLQDSSLAAA